MYINRKALPMTELPGHTVLVTGANRGMGREYVARHFPPASKANSRSENCELWAKAARSLAT